MGNYLYNGVELPDINEVWPKPKEQYPYAIIYSNGSVANILFHPTAFWYDTTSNEVKVTGGGTKRLYSLADGVWVFTSAQAMTANEAVLYAKATWSNHDINDQNGNLVLAASDPVPVLQLNPAALMQGFANMLSLGRNRT